MQKTRSKLVNKTFGLLRVKAYSDTRHGHARWQCRCRCGRFVVVYGLGLTSGKTKSCGCLRSKMRAESNVERRIHGKAGTWLYRIWTGIKTRCFNERDKAFPKYGGRGIGMHAPWVTSFSEFQAYIEKLGPRPSRMHSLDRRENDEGYAPGNLRWATKREQACNTRSNVRIEFRGESRTLSEWSAMIGISGTALRNRLKRWPLEEALTRKKKI